jgi:uncharacterized damage-inducible protein DinB
MKQHFEQFALYNRWANARLYQAAFGLSDSDYRRNVGAFFKSMHGTLNHLLLTDRLWFKRLTGIGDHPLQLNAILYEDRRDLALARADEDERIIGVITGYPVEGFGKSLEYATTSGKPHTQPLRNILAHIFNHQTHHRRQAHTILSILTAKEPPPLDLLAFQRNVPTPDLRGLAMSASAS